MLYFAATTEVIAASLVRVRILSARVTNLLLSVGDQVCLAEAMALGLPCCFRNVGTVKSKEFHPDRETLVYFVEFAGAPHPIVCTRRMLVKQ